MGDAWKLWLSIKTESSPSPDPQMSTSKTLVHDQELRKKGQTKRDALGLFLELLAITWYRMVMHGKFTKS